MKTYIIMFEHGKVFEISAENVWLAFQILWNKHSECKYWNALKVLVK